MKWIATHSLTLALVLFCTAGIIAPCAAADPASLTGNWVGTIKATSGDPLRYISIPSVKASGEVRGGMGTAKTFRHNNVTMTIDGERVEFLNNGGNGAKLELKGETLVGKWQNGSPDRQVDITFTKSSNDPVFAAAGSAGPPAAARPAAAPETLSPTAKMIYDQMKKDRTALIAACKGHRAGVSQYVVKTTGQLMASGKLTENPTSDAQSAGEAIGVLCVQEAEKLGLMGGN